MTDIASKILSWLKLFEHVLLVLAIITIVVLLSIKFKKNNNPISQVTTSAVGAVTITPHLSKEKPIKNNKEISTLTKIDVLGLKKYINTSENNFSYFKTCLSNGEITSCKKAITQINDVGYDFDLHVKSKICNTDVYNVLSENPTSTTTLAESEKKEILKVADPHDKWFPLDPELVLSTDFTRIVSDVSVNISLINFYNLIHLPIGIQAGVDYSIKDNLPGISVGIFYDIKPSNLVVNGSYILEPNQTKIVLGIGIYLF